MMAFSGVLRYRGYPIEELAEHSSFLEVAFLLYYGELPSRQQLTDFTAKVLREQQALHTDVMGLIHSFRCLCSSALISHAWPARLLTLIPACSCRVVDPLKA